MVNSIKNWIDDQLTKLRQKYILWRTGCNSWKEYLQIYDPNVYYSAWTVQGFYHGYPYVYRWSDANHLAYFQIKEWCEKNCKYRYRFDCHRIGSDEDWRFNEMFGTDRMFVAFTDKRDYNWFVLKWS